MIKNIISKICIISGLTLILISSFLFVQNFQTEEQIKASTNDILVELFDIVEKNDTKNEEQSEVILSQKGEEIVVKDNLYTFILNIPSLNLTLPVQSNWSYEKLNISPCVYKEKPLSIAAHNYDAHFGRLSSLKLEETVTIKYFSGELIEYKIVSIKKIHETNIDELEDDSYDLSLFTCNYSNNNERILIRLNKIQ